MPSGYGDLAFPGLANGQRRDCFAGSHSTVCHREERSDLAFPELANREKRDCRAALALGCHRERSAMCPLGMAISPVLSWQTDKGEIASQARNDKMGEIASQARTARSVIASVAQCALWVWRSRLSRAGKRTKERLLRRLAMTDERCHREVRSDIGCSGLANG